MKLSKRAHFLIDNLDLAAATGIETARWEHFQLAHLSDDRTFRIEDKSRQIAWSFTVAAESVAEALLTVSDTLFVSINLDEAMEKIRYARRVFECLRLGGLPRLTRDNELSLEFSNGTRIMSLPSKPPRGKARMNVVLDEFAHVQHDREIYTAALPIISKGGRLRIGSSPMGASGIFWEVYSEKMRPYPGYARKATPWWEVQAFCADVRQARRLAPGMPTAQRVESFGTERLQAIYANMPEEDFQQEYECEFVDESTAWITWAEILANQSDTLWHCQARTVDEALAAIDQVAQACRQGVIETALAGGMDIGRKRDLTELVFVGKATTRQYPYRLGISLAQVSFESQLAVASKALDILPVTKFLVDQTGIGMQLAESLEKRFPLRAEGVSFTNASKELWSTELKVHVQRGATPLPVDRELAYQLHSVKKKVTANKNVVFDTEGSEKHHADKYWALALAIWAAARGQQYAASAYAGLVETRGENKQ